MLKVYPKINNPHRYAVDDDVAYDGDSIIFLHYLLWSNVHSRKKEKTFWQPKVHRGQLLNFE